MTTQENSHPEVEFSCIHDAEEVMPPLKSMSGGVLEAGPFAQVLQAGVAAGIRDPLCLDK